MVLDPYRSPPRPHSRWRWLLIAGIPVALVPGLALCTLHPLTAQEESAPRMRYAEVPAGAERKGSSAAKVSRVPATQIQLDLLVMSVDRKKLAAADITLEDTIAEATESRCRREAGLVVADVQPGEVQKIVEALKRHEAVKVVSEPSIITLDGREAHFHVGGELPLLRIEETVNGRYERRIEHQAFGTMLTVRPKLKNLNGQRVALDLLAEQASLLPPGKAAGEGDVARELPGLVSHKFKLASDVALGGSLLVAESPAEKERRDHDAQFLLVISPKRAIRKDIVVYANPVQGEKATAPYAASAAEPEPGTAAEALLKAERDARQKETAELMRQIEMLKEQLARFQVKPAADPAAEAIPEARLERANRDLYSADVAEARLNLERAENEFARVEQMKDKGLISDTAFEDKQYALELAKIQLRRAESNLFAPPARLPAAADSAAGRPPVDPQTEIRLLELDLAEARLELEVNEAELAQAEEIKQKASAAISEQELRTLRLKVQRAKIQLERVGVQLAAAQRRLQQSR